MHRLIWVFNGRTGHFVGFVMWQLILFVVSSFEPNNFPVTVYDNFLTKKSLCLAIRENRTMLEYVFLYWTLLYISLTVKQKKMKKNKNFMYLRHIIFCIFLHSTVMILSFRTDRPGQTVQTQIRLLLEEQSDQGLHCLPFRLHRLDSLVYGKAT